MEQTEPFSASYAEAREKFLAAATRRGLEITSYPHPLRGCDGEALAIDVARFGAPDASKLLMVSSGCHGVEGYCGSGVQVAALNDMARLEQAGAAGVAMLFIHAINPYGFSHTRRVTNENMDLNRNFQDFSAPLPENPAYRQLHALLLPPTWPPGLMNMASIALLIVSQGIKALQAAISGGQYEFADGLFFGGRAPSWSNLTVRQLLREHAARAKQLVWIDLHTGLGPSGHGELNFGGRREDAGALARARRWWGSEQHPIKLIWDGSSVSAPVTGMMWPAAYDECPQAEITALAIEFGTQPLMKVMRALRGEQWLQLHPEASVVQAARIRRAMRDAFYVNEPAWQQQVMKQASQVLRQAIQGLKAGSQT